MRTYKAFYKNQVITVMAATSYAAQLAAAKVFKAKKSYDVAVVLADVMVEPASI
jgi:ABC-type branched-subunit amino acid transport system substrate-binding protein